MSGKSSTKIEISFETMERLKKIAQPFTDTPESVISRLIDYYEGAKDVIEQDKKSSTEFFKTKDGTKIPLGKIHGTYRPRGTKITHTIRGKITKSGIEVDGKVFNDLSSAARYGKKKFGADNSAASTNGWRFWRISEENNNKNMLLYDLRKQQKHANLTLEDLGL